MASPLSKEELRKFRLLSKDKESHNVIRLKFELPKEVSLNLPIGKHVKIW